MKTETDRSRGDSLFVYLLPMLHLVACVEMRVAKSEVGWGYLLFIFDFPVSLILGPIVWRFDHPMFWVGVFGTAWWYFLSVTVRRRIRRYRGWPQDHT